MKKNINKLRVFMPSRLTRQLYLYLRGAGAPEMFEDVASLFHQIRLDFTILMATGVMIAEGTAVYHSFTRGVSWMFTGTTIMLDIFIALLATWVYGRIKRLTLKAEVEEDEEQALKMKHRAQRLKWMERALHFSLVVNAVVKILAFSDARGGVDMAVLMVTVGFLVGAFLHMLATGDLVIGVWIIASQTLEKSAFNRSGGKKYSLELGIPLKVPIEGTVCTVRSNLHRVMRSPDGTYTLYVQSLLTDEDILNLLEPQIVPAHRKAMLKACRQARAAQL